MSIKVDMTSTDVDRQIALLEFYPEVADKHYRGVMTADVGLLESEIEPNIPQRTGKARETFKSRVVGTGLSLMGQVGWWGKNTAWYINIVEHGAKEHPIEARDGGFLWFGGHVYRSVQHPGFPGRGFMMAGFSAIQPIIEADLQQANENILSEMEIR